MASKKKYRYRLLKNIILHLLFWIIVVLYFTWAMGFNTDVKKHIINSLYFLPGHMIIVYPILYFLVPKYLLKRKFIHFFIGLILLVFICQIYAMFFQYSINTNEGIFKGMSMNTGKNVLPYIHVGGIALTIKLLKHWYEQKTQTVKAEQQKTLTELKLLRTQVHPHFLFNTLENLHTHTLEGSRKAPEIVLKLSSLLRFMIYESNISRIPLIKEIELLKNYIDLEQLRYGNRLDFSITISGNIKEYQIAPLLLLPFLENAFKYGTSQQIEQCWISLDLSIVDSSMYFKLVNSVEMNKGTKAKKVSGLGLQNVKRRLELLYKDKYSFETILQDEVFIVNLNLQLEYLEEKFEQIMTLT